MEGSTTYAQNCATGAVAYSGANPATVINDAIAALTSGGSVYIEAGTYTFTTAPINLGGGTVAAIGTTDASGAKAVSNVELYGAGNSTILSEGTNLNAAVIGVLDANGWNINDLQVNGNRASQSAVGNGPPYLIGIVLFNSNNDVVEHCYVHDDKTYGMEIYGTSDNILDNWVVNSNANGIILYGGSNYLVEGNSVVGASDVGISISGMETNSPITNVLCSGNFISEMNLGVSPFQEDTGEGILIGDNGPATSVTVSGNQVSTVLFGVYSGPAVGTNDNITISGNHVSSATEDGIDVWTTTGATVQGNTVNGAGLYGIGIWSGSDITVSGNTITAAVGGSIYVNPSATDVTVENNTTTSTTTTLQTTTTSSSTSYLPGVELSTLLSVYNSRPDLQSLFPEAASGNYVNLVNWASCVVNGCFSDGSYSALATYGYWYALMSIYNGRSDLQSLFPNAYSSSSSYQGLVNWAAGNVQKTWSDSSFGSLELWGYYYVLMSTYNGRADLQSLFPNAYFSTGNYQGLVNWAGGVVTKAWVDGSYPTLRCYGYWYDLMMVYDGRSDLQSLFHVFETTTMGHALVHEDEVKNGKGHIVTVKDLMKLYQGEFISSRLTIDDVASAPVFALSRGTRLDRALTEMVRRKFRRVQILGTRLLTSDNQILGYLFGEERMKKISNKPERLLDGVLEDVKSVEPLWISGRSNLKDAAVSLVSKMSDCAMSDRGMVTPWDLIVKPWRLGGLTIG